MKLKKSQVLKLEKLRAKAMLYSKRQDELVEEALEITKEQDEAGHTFDFILNDLWSLEDLLDRLGIEYEK